MVVSHSPAEFSAYRRAAREADACVEESAFGRAIEITGKQAAAGGSHRQRNNAKELGKMQGGGENAGEGSPVIRADSVWSVSSDRPPGPVAA